MASGTARAGDASTLARTNPERAHAPVNLGVAERWLSVVGGGALALRGLRQGSLSGLALTVAGAGLIQRGLRGHCPVYAELNVSTASPRHAATSIPAGRGIKVERTITIGRAPEDLYSAWRHFENFPRFMSHLEAVTTEGNRSHWIARAPWGMTVAWDAEIINERPFELIAWRSLPGGDVDCAGSVHFTPAPGARGTEVRVVLKYDPPAGSLGSHLAWLLGENPERTIAEDLRRFKQLMECGVISTTQGQSSCRRS